MTAPTHQSMLDGLRAAVEIGDASLEAQRRGLAAAIRLRVDKASPGPWTLVDRRTAGRAITIYRHPAGSHNQIANVLRGGPRPAADADLIGNAPADLTWLLAELDRLRAERDLLLASADDRTRFAYYSHRAEARQAELRARRRPVTA